MTPKCHRCMEGYFHPSAERPGTLVCSVCRYYPTVTLDKAEEIRVRAVEVLRAAQRELTACDFSLEAWRRGDAHSMPSTIGRVRSRVERALELLQGLVS